MPEQVYRDIQNHKDHVYYWQHERVDLGYFPFVTIRHEQREQDGGHTKPVPRHQPWHAVKLDFFRVVVYRDNRERQPHAHE